MIRAIGTLKRLAIRHDMAVRFVIHFRHNEENSWFVYRASIGEVEVHADTFRECVRKLEHRLDQLLIFKNKW